MRSLKEKVEYSISILGGYELNDSSKFSPVDYASEALACGLLVHRKTGSDKIFASSPEKPWFPNVLGWVNQRAISTSKQARRVTNNKLLAHEALLKNDLPIAESLAANSTDFELVSQFCDRVGWPVVIKPVNGMQGRGVVTDISKDDIKRVLATASATYKKVLVQKQVEGVEYRVYATRDRVIAALGRIPAHVVGNNGKDVRALIEENNVIRSKNIGLKYRLVKPDSHDVAIALAHQGLSLESVPNDGEVVPVAFGSNISAGGTAVGVTEDLHPEIAEIAVQAVRSMPDRPYAGVDLILSKGHRVSIDLQDVTILEVNDPGRQQGHLYPTYGKPRNVVKDVIESAMLEANIPILPQNVTYEVVVSFYGVDGSLKSFLKKVFSLGFDYDHEAVFGRGGSSCSVLLHASQKTLKQLTDKLAKLPCHTVVFSRKDAISQDKFFLYSLQGGLPTFFLEE